jgi:NAD(P)-dependent dehydrogenase (short-subunit alcohol dehydrogenase family)
VVVVGGSRGLGSALALALLARGHSVHVVYSVCDSAAKELQRLAGARSGALTLHCVDAADPLALAAVAAAVEPELAGLVLCAAPTPLPMALTPDTAGELSAYVAETVRLAATPLSTFGPLLRRPTGWMVFCSAAAVAEPIRELPQFGPAKAAIEGLAHTAAGAFPSAPVLVARLPRMRTDLVNTPSGRARVVRPDAIAAELADRLTAELEAGVTVLTPSGAVVGAS